MKREALNYYLQKAPEQDVFALAQKITLESEVVHIQKPTQQTLLLPVRDPINNGEFISGEVLVTSAIVQVNGVNGWSMVMDQNIDLARAVAVLDGAFAAGICQKQILTLAEKGQTISEREEALENQKVQDTRVSFDLM